MEPITEASADDPAQPATESAGRAALLVCNGRQSGTRRPLDGALTLLGRAPNCDVRIDVEGVEALHCVLVEGPTGYELRDLGGVGTAVNGQLVNTCRLTSGDRIAVGPFLFALELPPTPQNLVGELERERDALRVQAAAVVAQQAALDEQEQTLEQQTLALAHQQEELAAHLEERRRKLQELREQVKQERDQLDADRAALVEERAAVGEVRKAAEHEQQRLRDLRKRLQRRWRRHFDAEKAALAKREQELTAGQERLRGAVEEFQRNRGALEAARLRFNGEAELGRRQLREGWEQLALAQQDWEVCLNQEQTERVRRERALEERTRSVTRAEQTLAEEVRRWQRKRADLEKETTGLEARIRNQRSRLLKQEEQLARLEATQKAKLLPPPPSPWPSLGQPTPETTAPPAADDHLPARVQRLAGSLADQRLHLLEQWRALLQVHDSWQQERDTILAELEATAQHLAERERQVAERERNQGAREEEVRRRQESLSEFRLALEGRQMRLAADEVVGKSERVQLLADLQGREAALASHSYHLDRLRRRWTRRRRREGDALRLAEARCDEARREYVALWEACQRREVALGQELRALTVREAALERFRLECLGSAPDAAAAEKRIHRLRREEEELFAAADKALERARQELLDEQGRLEERATELERLIGDGSAREERRARQQSRREACRIAAVDRAQRHRLELRRLRVRHEQDERQLAELRSEVERVARLLIDGGESALALPAPQAA